MKRLPFLLVALLLFVPVGSRGFAQQSNTDELVKGNTAFAFDLYSELRQSADGNLLFSPYSISQALAMTYAGAEGQTATQMADSLHFTVPEPALHEAFGTLNADLVARGTAAADPEHGAAASALHIANGLWGEQTYPFDPEYLALLEQNYGAGLQQIDFKNAPEAAREEINDWVADQTEGRIQNIVPSGAIDKCTRLVLADAIYFYSGWEHTFNPNATADDDFFLLDGTKVSVPLMVQRLDLPYAQGNGFQVVELPYDGSNFAFTVILPDEGQFEAIEDGLDATTLDAALSAMASTDVRIYLPKFEFTHSIRLVQPLQSLGMPDAFDPNLADFSGMLVGPQFEADPDCTVGGLPVKLVVDDVLHKAFISVDEEKTEAAAVTSVIGTVAAIAAPQTPVEPLEVRVDHPFLFAIRDTQTGTILFLGRVMDPTVIAGTA